MVSENKARWKLLVRHAVAIASVFPAHVYLESWYEYRHPGDYLLFSAFFGCFLALAGYRFFLEILRAASRPVRVGILILLFFLVPWGEWLGIQLPAGDWCRALFRRILFLYVIGTFLWYAKSITDRLSTRTVGLLRRAATKKYLLYTPPVLFFFLTCWISIFVYHQIPITTDSLGHIFQARVFLSGRAYAPAPPASEFFSVHGDMVAIYDNRWVGIFPPGLSLLIALPLHFGFLVVIPPLLGALTLAVWIAYIRRFGTKKSAILFGILGLFSPFLFVMSSTLMIHSLEVLIISAVVFLCRVDLEESSPARRNALFFLLAFSFLVRPFSILPFLLPVLVYTMIVMPEKGTMTFTFMVLAGLGCGALLLGLYQWAAYGNPLQAGQLLEFPLQRIGLGPSLGHVHTMAGGLENTSTHVSGLDLWLTGWYSGSLFFVLMFFVLRKGPDPWDLVLLLSCSILVIFYFFFIRQDLILGPRFYFPLAPVALFFISRIADLTKRRLGRWVLACLVLSFLFFFPARFSHFVTLRRTPENGFSKQLRDFEGEQRIVFLQGNLMAYTAKNDPLLKSNLIYCKDLKARNVELHDYFPEHKPLYYRLIVSEDGFQQTGTYVFREDAGDEDPAYFGFYEFAAALSEASRDRDIDIFDLLYDGDLRWTDSALQLEYVERRRGILLPKSGSPNAYRDHLRFGLIHLARCILQPKAAYERYGAEDWMQEMNFTAYRSDLAAAKHHFREAGLTGLLYLRQTEKIENRIDRNDNGNLTDEELRMYLRKKIQNLEFW